VGCICPLEVSLRRKLKPFDRRSRSGSVAENEFSIHNPFLIGVQEMVAVDSGDVRASRQLVPQRRLPELTIHTRHESPDAGSAASKLLEQPAGKVVRERFDFRA
jgi:hypothetical protein